MQPRCPLHPPPLPRCPPAAEAAPAGGGPEAGGESRTGSAAPPPGAPLLPQGRRLGRRRHRHRAVRREPSRAAGGMKWELNLRCTWRCSCCFCCSCCACCSSSCGVRREQPLAASRHPGSPGLSAGSWEPPPAASGRPQVSPRHAGRAGGRPRCRLRLSASPETARAGCYSASIPGPPLSLE